MSVCVAMSSTRKLQVCRLIGVVVCVCVWSSSTFPLSLLHTRSLFLSLTVFGEHKHRSGSKFCNCSDTHGYEKSADSTFAMGAGVTKSAQKAEIRLLSLVKVNPMCVVDGLGVNDRLR